MQRDEPRVAAHHFDDHHPLMAFGSRMDLVDRVCGGGHRGVEAKRRDGATDVVVDRLGHANDWKALLPQRPDDAERPFAADRHESIQPIRAKGFEQLVRPIQFRPRPVRLLRHLSGSRRFDVPRIVPPRCVIPRTSLGPSGMSSPSPSRLPNPRLIPTHSQPRWTALNTTARMTAFSPGASPPPVEIAILTAWW